MIICLKKCQKLKEKPRTAICWEPLQAWRRIYRHGNSGFGWGRNANETVCFHRHTNMNQKSFNAFEFSKVEFVETWKLITRVRFIPSSKLFWTSPWRQVIIQFLAKVLTLLVLFHIMLHAKYKCSLLGFYLIVQQNVVNNFGVEGKWCMIF